MTMAKKKAAWKAITAEVNAVENVNRTSHRVMKKFTDFRSIVGKKLKEQKSGKESNLVIVC